MESTSTVADPIELAQQLLAERNDAPDIYKLPYGFEPRHLAAAMMATLREGYQPIEETIPARGLYVDNTGRLETVYGSTLSDKVFRMTLQGLNDVDWLKVLQNVHFLWSLASDNSIAIFESTKMPLTHLYISYHSLASAIIQQREKISTIAPIPAQRLPQVGSEGKLQVHQATKDGSLWSASFSVDYSTPQIALNTFGKIQGLKVTKSAFALMQKTDGTMMGMLPYLANQGSSLGESV